MSFSSCFCTCTRSFPRPMLVYVRLCTTIFPSAASAYPELGWLVHFLSDYFPFPFSSSRLPRELDQIKSRATLLGLWLSRFCQCRRVFACVLVCLLRFWLRRSSCLTDLLGTSGHKGWHRWNEPWTFVSYFERARRRRVYLSFL